MDECCFNADKMQTHGWAPVNDPLVIPYKYSEKKYVAVLGVIDQNEGQGLMLYKTGNAINANDVNIFLHELRKRIGGYDRIIIFTDNASIHKTKYISYIARCLNI